MSQTFTLITAILMTMAAVTWLVSAVMVPHEAGGALLRWGVVIVFALMAVVYWRLYFKRKSANTPGME